MYFIIVLLGICTGVFIGVSFIIFIVLTSSQLLQKLRPQIELLSILKRFSWRNYFESQQRAATGKPLDRPYGAVRAVFDWNKIQFNPVYLSQTPYDSSTEIDTSVILGPQAKRPLSLKIPIMIAGMAYGSGYSAAAKIALAKASTMAGTAANTGNGPFLENERRFAEKLIIQYPRGFWSKTETILKQADMIEIALGHSARGSAPVRINGKKITPEVAEQYGTIAGLDVLMEARLPESETKKNWFDLVKGLKDITGGVPIAVKFGATHYLEEEMQLFIEGGIDVIVFDGLEGGTHGGMPLFMDDMGLPIFPALCRAAKFFRDNKLYGKVSLVVGGGLVTPGDFVKCLALGADAVIIGTITALVQNHTQITKAIPWEPPTGILYNDGKEKKKYNSDLGAKHLNKYFQSCIKEMQLLARTIGKPSLREINHSNLVALDPLYAKIAEINHIGDKT